MFKNNKTHKPVTDEQYEDLTNEFIVELDKLAYPKKFEAEFVGAILANALHSADLKGGFQSKSKIFDVVVDLIAKRLSYGISEGIRLKLEAQEKARGGEVSGDLPPSHVEAQDHVEASGH